MSDCVLVPPLSSCHCFCSLPISRLLSHEIILNYTVNLDRLSRELRRRELCLSSRRHRGCLQKWMATDGVSRNHVAGFIDEHLHDNGSRSMRLPRKRWILRLRQADRLSVEHTA